MKVHVEHRTRPLRVVFGAWVMALLGAVMPLDYSSALRAVLVFFVLFGGPALLAAVAHSPVLGVRRRAGEGSIARRGELVAIETEHKKLAFRLRALDGAWREGNRLTLSFHGRLIVRAESDRADELDALLAELGYGPKGRAAKIPIGAPTVATARAFFAPMSMFIALIGASLVFGALLSFIGASWAIAVVLLTFAVGAFAASMVLARATLGSDVILGDDGAWVRRGLYARYLPFTELEPHAQGRKVYLGPTELCATSSRVEANELLRQVAQRRAAAHAVAKADDRVLASALDRGENDVRAWREQLERIASVTSYRDRAVTDEALAAVVEDAREPPDRRAAAALALGARAGDQGKTRVRVAAAACAHPKLRVSLETAADGELDAVALQAVARSRQKP